MNYEEGAERYMKLRNQVDELDRQHKTARAKLVQEMNLLENWFTAKAQEDGLESVKTPMGTAYWSMHNTATVASREEFFDFCRGHNLWDLVESRASKTGVKSYIEAYGEAPPGVNFSSVRVFNFRKANAKD